VTDVKRTSIGDVPVLWGDAPPPFRAALLFGVGRSDESLPTLGLSHLVEHLALSRLQDRRYEFNGFVDPIRTVFHAAGTQDEVVDFLQRLAESLSNLDLERLDHEKRILSTEAAGRTFGAGDVALAMRFGPRGLGLSAYEEFGLRTVTADDVASWAGRYFGSSNAVLWLSGPPPSGLRLDLPASDAARGREPDLAGVDLPLPCWTSYQSRWVSLTMLGPRSAAFSTGMAILSEELKRDLRHEGGLSYSVGGTYHRVGVNSAYAALWADSAENQAQATVDRLWALTERAAHEGVAEATLEAHKGDWARHADDPAVWPARLDAAASNVLFGTEPFTQAELTAEREALTVAEIGAELDRALQTGFLVVPAGATPPEVRLRPMPAWSQGTVSGRTLRPADPTRTSRLTVGDAGTMVAVNKDQRVCIAYADVEALLRWDDGSRVLMDRHGFRVEYRPEQWQKDPSVPATIDAGVAASKWVPMGERNVAPPPQRPLPGTFWVLLSLAVLGALAGSGSLVSGSGSGAFSLVVAAILGVRALALYLRVRRPGPRRADPAWLAPAIIAMSMVSIWAVLVAAGSSASGPVISTVSWSLVAATAIGATIFLVAFRGRIPGR
jgi:zinc protease